MSGSGGNGEKTYVTPTELADKLGALRWELRSYMLLIVLGVLLRFQVPETAAAAIGRLLP